MTVPALAPPPHPTHGLLIFDGAEELDFVGPWEVFTASSALRHHADTVLLLAERPDAIRCSNGMRVLPDHTLDSHPPLDVLLVPGGEGARREMANPAMSSMAT
jgi:putative intracellular protease/amidase